MQFLVKKCFVKNSLKIVEKNKLFNFSSSIMSSMNRKMMSIKINTLIKKSFSTNDAKATTCSMSQVEDVDKFFKRETEDYFIHQFNTACLSQYSYYVESNGEAAIIDPIRETDMYVELLNKRGAKLKYILETHFHADFVSGHLELAKATGAKIVFGPQAKTKLDVKVAKDREHLPLGKVNIEVLHTPGHTLESSSFVLLDSAKSPKAIFTGDFLFLGEVGRPDLAVGNGITENDLAAMLYDSITRLKKEYPGELVIFPGHGAGSACGKNIAKGSADTLRNQKKINYALNDNLSKPEFIEIVTSNLPTPPSYFFHDAMLNKSGYESVDSTLNKSLTPLKPEKFASICESDPSVVVIDARDFSESRNLFLQGAYLVPIALPFAVWVANLIKPEQKILLITGKNKEKEAIVRLARVGYENVIGYLDGPVEELKPHLKKLELKKVEVTPLNKLKSTIEDNNNSQNFQILDVREETEWNSTGTLRNAQLHTLKKLEKEIEEIKPLAKKNKIGIYCKTGGRATIAASILIKHGINNIFVLGGTDQIIDQKVTLYPLIKH